MPSTAQAGTIWLWAESAGGTDLRVGGRYRVSSDGLVWTNRRRPPQHIHRRTSTAVEVYPTDPGLPVDTVFARVARRRVGNRDARIWSNRLHWRKPLTRGLGFSVELPGAPTALTAQGLGRVRLRSRATGIGTQPGQGFGRIRLRSRATGAEPAIVVPVGFAILAETARPGVWQTVGRPLRWDAVTRTGRWFGTTRSDHWFETIFVREDRPVALTLVAYGPFTENEIPEALLVRVLKPLRAGGTTPLHIYNQTPAYTATVSIQPPTGPVSSRSAEILNPAQLPTDYPDDFSVSEEGWLRVTWQDGDFPDSGVYGVQVTLDNGSVRLKSTDVWDAEVNVGPASDVT